MEGRTTGYPAIQLSPASIHPSHQSSPQSSSMSSSFPLSLIMSPASSSPSPTPTSSRPSSLSALPTALSSSSASSSSTKSSASSFPLSSTASRSPARSQAAEWASLLDSAVNDICSADFVAVDLEFTGLFLDQIARPITLVDYFSQCFISAKKFFTPQLGICAIRQDRTNPRRWLLYPYTFPAMTTNGNQIFSVDLNTLRFLRESGFDFNKWISTGIDFDRLCVLQGNHDASRMTPVEKCVQDNKISRKRRRISNEVHTATEVCDEFDAGTNNTHCINIGHVDATGNNNDEENDGDTDNRTTKNSNLPRRNTRDNMRPRGCTCRISDEICDCVGGRGGLQRIIEALIEDEKPVILHNGHLDIIHVYDKFIGELPSSLREFSAEILRLFTGGIFDTKFMATIRQENLPPQVQFQRTTQLYPLRDEMLKCSANCFFEVARSRLTDFALSFSELNCPHKLSRHRAHDAGMDALATAQVFVCYISLALSKGEHQTTRINVKPFESFLKFYRDKIAVSGVHPGFLDLKKKVQESRKIRLNVNMKG